MKESIADRINRAAVKIAQQPSAPVGGMGAAVTKQLAAKSGKAVGTESTGQSYAGEAVAGAQIASQKGAIAEKLRESAAAAGQKEQAAEVDRKQFEAQQRLQSKELESQRNTQIETILGELSRSDKELEQREDALQLFLAGTQLAQKNENYIHNLQLIGKRDRLDDEVNAKREATRLAIGNSKARLLEEISFTKEEGSKSRQFKEANLIEDMETADRYVQAMIEDSVRAAKVGAWTSVGKAGVDLGSAYAGGKFDTPKTQTSDPYAATPGSGGQSKNYRSNQETF